MSQSSCFQHPETVANTRCGGCDKPLCTRCAVFEGGKDRCQACVERYHAGKKTRTVMIAAALGVAGVGAGAWFMLRPADATSEAAAPAFDYGKKAVLIRHLQDELKRQPCDKTKGREYAQALFDAGDLKGTIQAGDDFIAKCGKSTALRQLTYSAHTQLQEHDLAAKDVTELIEGAPDNAGYRIWRGMAHEASDASDAAVADFQQAFLLKPGEAQIANLLSTVLSKQGRACDGRRVVLEHFLANPPKSLEPKMKARLTTLADTSPCTGDGKGSAVVSLQGAKWAEVKVDGKQSGRFALDTDSVRVVLSKAFAERLGLKLDGAPSARLQTAEDILTVQLVKVGTLEVQGVRADDLEVAVADTLPEGADGLLGLNFLARFDAKVDAKAGRLELAERKGAQASATP